MIVKLRRKNKRYQDLTPGQQDLVIGIEADDFRVLNNKGRPYLHPRHLFEVVDPHEPADWLTEYGEDGERYTYPLPLNLAGFLEDFFDGKSEAVVTSWRVVNQGLALASEVA